MKSVSKPFIAPTGDVTVLVLVIFTKGPQKPFPQGDWFPYAFNVNEGETQADCNRQARAFIRAARALKKRGTETSEAGLDKLSRQVSGVRRLLRE